MKRLIFEEEHDMFRDSVRSFFINEIQPHGERWREQGIVDREAYLKAGEQGLLLMWADEKYGGAGVRDFRYEQILMEELTQHGDAGFFLWLHSRLVAPYIDEFGTEEGFRGYGPENGYDFLLEPIREHDYAARDVAIDADEIFVSDGSKQDSGNIQELFAGDCRIAVTDPVYPVYVDTNVMAGRTGGVDAEGRFHGLDMTALFNNIAQCPALSVPSGMTSSGLPTAIQIVGRRFDDPTVLRIGKALEAARPWAESLAELGRRYAG